MSEERSAIDQIRGQASAASRMKVAEKARAVRACIRNGIALGIDEREIFQLSYGDESGSEYWKSFLNQPMTEAELIRALAAHLATPLHASIANAPAVSMIELPTARLAAIIAQIPADMKPGGSKAFPDAIIQALLRMSPDELPSSLLNHIQPPAPDERPKQQAPAAPGPRPVQREALKRSIRLWATENGIPALRDLGLDEAMCIFTSKKTLTYIALEEVRKEFAVRE